MFHFPWSHFEALCIQTPILHHNAEWVAPFGNPRIKACVPLPEAYRSLPRPSSPVGAKASIVCPFAFDQETRLSRIFSCLPVSMQFSKNNSRLNSGPSPMAFAIEDRNRHSSATGCLAKLVGVPGIEPGTLSLSGTRSNQLSYTPGFATLLLAMPGRNHRVSACASTAF